MMLDGRLSPPLWLLAVLAALGGCGHSQRAPREIYEQACAGCHGPEGRGDGIAAPFVWPPPRDLTRGQRWGSGLEDLRRVIGEGIPGTSMPGFAAILDTAERDAVAGHVLELLPVEPPRPLPAPGPGDVARGARLYGQLCQPCHGASGHGDGPLASQLRDAHGHRAWPRNLRAEAFKGGESTTQIKRRIVDGIPGTPMPAFGPALEPQAVADLVGFVLSLRPADASSAPTQLELPLDGGLEHGPPLLRGTLGAESPEPLRLELSLADGLLRIDLEWPPARQLAVEPKAVGVLILGPRQRGWLERLRDIGSTEQAGSLLHLWQVAAPPRPGRPWRAELALSDISGRLFEPDRRHLLAVGVWDAARKPPASSITAWQPLLIVRQPER